MMDATLSMLQEAGLTPGETKVYLSLLKMGSSTVGPILEKASVSRSIVYHILERLMEKGLVSFVVHDKTKYYQAAEPARILDYIDERSKRLESCRKEVEGFLPSLEMARSMANQAQVNVFVGFKGLITVHEGVYSRLKRGESYFYMGIGEHKDYSHAYWKKDHLRRVKAGITCRLLFNQSQERSILADRNSYKGCEARYMPIKIDTPAFIGAYKDITVISLSSDHTITIEIIDKGIADSFKAYFEEFWKLSVPLENKKR